MFIWTQMLARLKLFREKTIISNNKTLLIDTHTHIQTLPQIYFLLLFCERKHNSRGEINCDELPRSCVLLVQKRAAVNTPPRSRRRTVLRREDEGARTLPNAHPTPTLLCFTTRTHTGHDDCTTWITRWRTETSEKKIAKEIYIYSSMCFVFIFICQH